MALVENIAAEFNTVDQSGAVGAVRKQAFTAFEKLGIPSTRHEEWKYTNIKTKLPETLSLQANNDDFIVSYNSFEAIKATKLVFINGAFYQNLSTIVPQQGITVTNLNTAFAEHNAQVEKHFGKLVQLNEEHFAALNTAFATDGIYIHVAKNTVAEAPIIITYLFTGGETFVQSRGLVIAEQGADLQIVEQFINNSSEAYSNHVTEVHVGANAHVNITQLQTETYNTTAVNTVEAEVGRDAKFTCTAVSFEGKLIRNNINARLRGENGEANFNGLYYAKGESLIDSHILVDHIVPNCQSNQLYKGVIDDEATGVFNGKIFVKQDAQKTNAFQSSKAILLSENAAINSKPQLEIFADDVKCSHGAAIGQLGGNEVFYLMARGIPETDAKAMLTFAFANDIIDKVEIAEIKEHLENVLRERLGLTV